MVRGASAKDAVKKEARMGAFLGASESSLLSLGELVGGVGWVCGVGCTREKDRALSARFWQRFPGKVLADFGARIRVKHIEMLGGF